MIDYHMEKYNTGSDYGLPSWDDISQDMKELVVFASKNDSFYGSYFLFNTLKSEKFDLQDQLYMIQYLYSDNYRFHTYELSPWGELADNTTWEDRVYMEMDSWDRAWRVAIQSGIPYKGFNPELSAIHTIVRD